MRSTAKHGLIALPVALLGACSGGGDSGGTMNPTTSTPPAEITSGNAQAIASAVVQTSFEGGGLGEFAGMGSGAVVSSPGSQLFATVGGIQKAQTDSLTQKAQMGALETTIPPQMEACLNSGSVTVSGEIANPLTFSSGDSFTLVFSDCDDGAGIINGTYVMNITSFGGDLLSGSFTLGMSVTLTGFSVADVSGTLTANGSISTMIDYTAAPMLSISMTSTSLTVSDGTTTETLGSFSLVQSIDELTSSFSMTVSGDLTSTVFSGSVSFSTSATLIGDGTGYAYSGEITIAGAGSASIDVIVLDNVLVRLEIDLNGDGIVDEIVDTTWDALLAQV